MIVVQVVKVKVIVGVEKDHPHLQVILVVLMIEDTIIIIGLILKIVMFCREIIALLTITIDIKKTNLPITHNIINSNHLNSNSLK